jgi:meso-butanediol dehydrogenase/(S,S)-butanediol dehydrogenase/diacetyl reductase
MPIDFSGKTAVVTGGANGIGAAIAATLTAGGANVWIFDRDPGESAQQLQVDVTDRRALEAAFDHAGSPDIVMVNAGMVVVKSLWETTRADWDRTLALNLTAAFETVQAAVTRMKPKHHGAIVLTASTNSFDGEENLIAYNATKAGLLGLLHTAAGELGPYGIRINAVCPGMIKTRLTQSLFDSPEAAREYFRQIPLGRGGEPAEVAQAAAFLASDLASFITGATLFVDGGQMATKFGPWRDETAQFEDGHWRLR